MSELWPHWLRPFWLLALPLLGWLLWQLWHRERRSGRWQLLLPPLLQQALLGAGRGQRYQLAWALLGCAWLLALLVLLGPSWQRVEQSSLRRDDPLVVVLDLTPAMLAADLPPSRLEQSRRKLLDLLELRQEAQTALVVYAGSAHGVVPLSDDLGTTRNLLAALSPAIMPEPGQRADLAVERAVRLLRQAGHDGGRVLLLTSRLSDEELDGIEDALSGQDIRLDVLGVGTPAGAPIALEGGGFLKDQAGAILVPRLQRARLAQLAREQDGRYASLTLDDQDLEKLQLDGSNRALREQGDPAILAVWADQGYWLLLPLLAIAALAGRRGWLFLILLCPLLQPRAEAAGWQDLWQRADQQGARLLAEGDARAAARAFEDPLWQGMALYQAGDYAGAAERFARFDTASAHYNRGNALARQGELDAALDAYDSALERQPDLQQARTNRELVERLKRQQQAQQQQAQATPAEQSESQPQQTGQASPQPTPPNESASPSQSGTPSPGERQPQPPPPQHVPAPAEPRPSTEQGQPGRSETNAKPVQGTEALPSVAHGEAREPLSPEQQQALEQWLRQIPDDPAELLKRKFWQEQQQRQEQRP